MKEKEVLVSASIYNKKYFLNEKFNTIPGEVIEELRITCITLSAKLHCIFSIGFYRDGRVYFESKFYENDISYDDIGAKMEINRLIRQKKTIISALELWYKVFILRDYGKFFEGDLK